MSTLVLVLNALFALLSGASSLVGALRPGIGAPAGESVTSQTRLFAHAYALRAAPLSLVALVLMATGPHAAGLAPMLTVLGVAQAGDSVIGVTRRNWGMTVTAAVGALLHFASAWYLATL
jgi:hypothetical protein